MPQPRALVSVSNKEGLIPFVKTLSDQGVELISTGGTKKAIEEAGIPVKGITDLTGFPEILDGRVKTLHPAVHGGLLAVRSKPEHMKAIEAEGITPIDYVIVNLYPFKETIARGDASFEDAIENIDIGGPSMLRSAAKNHDSVTVVCDPADYDDVAEAVKNDGSTSEELRRSLAAKVFRHTAHYDALIAEYLTGLTDTAFPETKTLTYEKKQDLRYGENPHQAAAFYEKPLSGGAGISSVKQLHGKALSYNNLRDADAAINMVKEFSRPAAVAVKHMNPCGIGTGETLAEAYGRAYEADPVSIFGGIVAANRPIDKETAEELAKIFLEIIIAPSFTDDAMEILTKKKNIRLLELDVTGRAEPELQVTSVSGGMLVQDLDVKGLEDVELTYPTKRQPTEDEMAALVNAWKAVKHVKSNAIVLAKKDQVIGVGAGQPNRVGAAKIAVEQAGDKARGAVMASDAFFPMGDTVEAAAEAGITAIIQPGGSIRDQESIDAADKHGIAMAFTGMRHFKH